MKRNTPTRTNTQEQVNVRTHRNKYRPIAIGMLSVATVAFAGCELVAESPGGEDYKNDRGRGDAPVGDVDDEPGDIINFPDLFPNVAVKCDAKHGNLVYVPVYKDGRPGTPVVVEGGCRK